MSDTSYPRGVGELASSIEGRWISLRPVGRRDTATFFRWRSDVFQLHLWAASKRIPTPEEFSAELEQMLRQSMTLLAVNRRDQQPVGFVQAYNLNVTEGWCYTLAYIERTYRRGHGAEAYLCFLDYLFRQFSFRKIYADIYEFNMDSIKPLMSVGFVEEGRFKEHTWFNDRYWDVIRLALYRDDWSRFRERSHFLIALAEEAAQLVPDGASRP